MIQVKAHFSSEQSISSQDRRPQRNAVRIDLDAAQMLRGILSTISSLLTARDAHFSLAATRECMTACGLSTEARRTETKGSAPRDDLGRASRPSPELPDAKPKVGAEPIVRRMIAQAEIQQMIWNGTGKRCHRAFGPMTLFDAGARKRLAARQG